MASINKQTGWSVKERLLREIIVKLDKLTKVIAKTN